LHKKERAGDTVDENTGQMIQNMLELVRLRIFKIEGDVNLDFLEKKIENRIREINEILDR
jgi:hypothetical protein